MEEIVLKVISGVASLSGNDLGKQVFKSQYKEFFEKNGTVCVVIPDAVERIGISFVQGFIHDIAEKHGKGNTKKYITIKASNPKLKQKFEESMAV